MGLLKKLYGESQRVRHKGNLGPETTKVVRGVVHKSNRAFNAAKYKAWEVRMKFGR